LFNLVQNNKIQSISQQKVENVLEPLSKLHVPQNDFRKVTARKIN